MTLLIKKHKRKKDQRKEEAAQTLLEGNEQKFLAIVPWGIQLSYARKGSWDLIRNAKRWGVKNLLHRSINKTKANLKFLKQILVYLSAAQSTLI